MEKNTRVAKGSFLDAIIDEAKVLLNTGHVTCCLVVLMVLGGVFSGFEIIPVFIPIVLGILSVLVKTRRIEEIIQAHDIDIKIQSNLMGLVLKLGSLEEGIFFKGLSSPKGSRSQREDILSRMDKILSHSNHSVVTRKTKKTLEYDFVLNSQESVHSLFIVIYPDSGNISAEYDTRSMVTGINDEASVVMKSSAETLKLLILMQCKLKNKESSLDLRSVA